jgi:FMN reductase
MYLIISSSLNPNSKSKKLAHYAKALFEKKSQIVDFLDLKDINMPYCDGSECYEHKNSKLINKKIENADCILISSPIYNYDLNSVIKNVLELSGSSWRNKKVGFLCAAGGYSSYMSPMSFINSLMLDYRCLIIPRYVYATGKDFNNNSIVSDEIKDRIEDLVNEAISITEKLF